MSDLVPCPNRSCRSWKYCPVCANGQSACVGEVPAAMCVEYALCSSDLLGAPNDVLLRIRKNHGLYNGYVEELLARHELDRELFKAEIQLHEYSLDDAIRFKQFSTGTRIK